jgi:hypothetical protein
MFRAQVACRTVLGEGTDGGKSYSRDAAHDQPHSRRGRTMASEALTYVDASPSLMLGSGHSAISAV